MKAIILAGGSGQRFWPVSTETTPKQFLPLFSQHTLIQQTYQRLLERFQETDIFIVTGSAYVERTLELLPSIPKRHVLSEPMRRNTGPAIMLGMMPIEENEIVGVFPADHMITNHAPFWKTIDLATNSISTHEGLYTFGVVPNRPETGYGYIEMGEVISPNVFHVKRFVEKPDLSHAKKMIDAQTFFWNSGIFFFRKSFFVDQMQIHCPQIAGPIVNTDPYHPDTLKKVYEMLPSISIDYALMERSNQVCLVKANFPWNDVGSWDAVADNTEGQWAEGRCDLIESEDVFIRNDAGTPITVVGLSNLLIVHTKEGLLICKKGMAEQVKKRFNP